MHRFIVIAALLVGTCFALPTRAAQSYDNCTGFIDSVPATVSKQGVWCLRKDVSTNNTSGNAITVSANNVAIDCNDFKIGGLGAGDASQAMGIYAMNRQNVTVRHCGVRGFLRGISVTGGAGALIEDNRLDNNLQYGIYAYGDNGRVRRNAVYDTGGAPAASLIYGIYSNADIVDNEVQGVFSSTTPSYIFGIAAYGWSVRDNRIAGLVVTGNANGYAAGITGFTNKTSAVGNQVFGGYITTAGTGINSVRFCANNTVGAFATSYSCGASIGNLP